MQDQKEGNFAHHHVISAQGIGDIESLGIIQGEGAEREQQYISFPQQVCRTVRWMFPLWRCAIFTSIVLYADVVQAHNLLCSGLDPWATLGQGTGSDGIKILCIKLVNRKDITQSYSFAAASTLQYEKKNGCTSKYYSNISKCSLCSFVWFLYSEETQEIMFTNKAFLLYCFICSINSFTLTLNQLIQPFISL